MPELPEVETTRRGIEPFVLGHRVVAVCVRDRRLRWPVPRALERKLPGQVVQRLERRAKYLLLGTPAGTVLLHLGMSGSLRIVDAGEPPRKHDHLDLVFAEGHALRLHDPRRFGTALWTEKDPSRHALLRELGVEPLEGALDGRYLFQHSRRRTVAVKNFVMNGHVVVGVGNIYASEALFRSGIHPSRPAGRVSAGRYERLAAAIKEVLNEALEAGGTTLRDYLGSHGEPGSFALHLDVYGRSGEPCGRCRTPIRVRRLGQRSAFFCPVCQR